MHLAVFFNHTGHHVASWLHSGAQIDAGVNIAHYVEMARIAERAAFDFLFFADSLAIRETDLDILSRCAQYTAYMEPLTILPALAVVTNRIGLVATASTSYNEPYHIARKFASLDHLSGGRAGWNVVTSTEGAEARNFGRDAHFGHEERYARAHEFVDVVRGLWDSWDDDAFVRDRSSGRYFDADKVHTLGHHGVHFNVEGPLNVPRPPQGHPVLVQAGSSTEGRDLSASIADVAFTGDITLEAAQEYYRDVKARAARYGRQPSHLKVLPAVCPILGRTTGEAERKFQELQSLIHPEVGVSMLSTILGGFELSAYPLDGPLPEIPPRYLRGGVQRGAVALAEREKLSIRELSQRLAGSRGKRTIVGDPIYVADQLEEWFSNDAADGFILQPAYLPQALEEFVELVVPELRRRGLFRTEYGGSTLRDHLELPRPVSRHAGMAKATPGG